MSSMKSIMGAQERIAHVPGRPVPRSMFNLSHPYKASGDAGFLYPVLHIETLPGDSFKCRTAIVARIATLLHPIMDNVFADLHFFFVPNRLIWENWERFMGYRPNPADSIDFIVPELDLDAYGEIQPDDFLGYMYGIVGCDFLGATQMPIALPARAYNLIWNEWFRAEQLQDSVNVPMNDGPDDVADYQLLRRGKRHDYFTSALPSPQMGPSVPISVADVIPVVGNGIALGLTNSSTDYGAVFPGGSPGAVRLSAADFGEPVGSAAGAGDAGSGTVIGVTDNPLMSGLEFDATAIGTINTLREAATLQQFFETENIFGNRYTEEVLGQFGVHTGDYRLQRPEYLGGGSQRISVSTVPQSGASEVGSPQANLAAFGVAGSSNGGGFSYTCVEHGQIIGLLSFRADLNWQQNLARRFTRRTRYDYYSPVFAHLGEQPVYTKELYMVNNPATDDTVFGYMPRWDEYRSQLGVIAGVFSSAAVQSLDSWHLAVDFDGSSPLLNSVFIQDNPPIVRIIADENQPQFLFQLYHDIKAARPMPVYAMPGLTRF